jgi:hypothetical protein
MAEQAVLASSVLPTMATSENVRTTASSAARAVSAERSIAGRLGLQRFGHFVTEAELTAHFRILDLIASRRAAAGGARGRTGRTLHDPLKERVFVQLFGDQLERFAPRCNCGRGPLKVRVDINLKRFSCVCGMRFIEAR